MDQMKQQIQQKLIANVVQDLCDKNQNTVFQDAWCTQERVVRFTTLFFRKLLKKNTRKPGKWGTGDAVMYEACNGTDTFIVNCMYDSSVLSADQKKLMTQLFPGRDKENPKLAHWDLSAFLSQPNDLFAEFEKLLNETIPSFEHGIQDEIDRIANIGKEYLEGEEVYYTLSKYERNREARNACIKAHGCVCAICGFDFGKIYGDAFIGIIEVHHIVPISTIGKEYILDPVNDLVPVCPNCHTALHSKKDGVYTVEELKEIIK